MNELEKEIAGLKRWKEDVEKVFINPILEYGTTIKMPYGSSITYEVIRRAKKLDGYTSMNQDLIKVLTEELELSIKAGRRMMHDFAHMLNEVPKDNLEREEYQERYEIWHSIFYPDNGVKNYRSDIFKEMEHLRESLQVAQKLLREHGIDSEPHKPF